MRKPRLTRQTVTVFDNSLLGCIVGLASRTSDFPLMRSDWTDPGLCRSEIDLDQRVGRSAYLHPAQSQNEISLEKEPLCH